eukprot:m51a1_g5971 hypothetical protein (764) ;mRNA; f:227882-231008
MERAADLLELSDDPRSVLARYVRDQCGDERAGAAFMREGLRWRGQLRLRDLRAADVAPALRRLCAYGSPPHAARARNGYRCVWVERLKEHRALSEAPAGQSLEELGAFAYLAEHEVGPSSPMANVLVDCSGIGRSQADERLARAILESASLAWPASLAEFYFYNAPLWLKLLAAALSPWMPKSWQGRVHVSLRSPGRGLLRKLPPEAVPRRLGGAADDDGFSADSYIRRMTQAEVASGIDQCGPQRLLDTRRVRKWVETLPWPAASIPDAIHSGRLRKAGGVVTTLTSFFCVLRPGELQYYRRESDRLSQGVVDLMGAIAAPADDENVVDEAALEATGAQCEARKRGFVIRTPLRQYVFESNSGSNSTQCWDKCWKHLLSDCVDPIYARRAHPGADSVRPKEKDVFCPCFKVYIQCLEASCGSADAAAELKDLQVPEDYCQKEGNPECMFETWGDPHFVALDGHSRWPAHLRGQWDCSDTDFPLLYEGHGWSLSAKAEWVNGYWFFTMITSVTLNISGKAVHTWKAGQVTPISQQELPAGWTVTHSNSEWGFGNVVDFITSPAGEEITIYDPVYYVNVRVFGFCEGKGHVQLGPSDCKVKTPHQYSWQQRRFARSSSRAVCGSLGGFFYAACMTDVTAMGKDSVASDSVFMSAQAEKGIQYLAAFGAPTATAAAGASAAVIGGAVAAGVAGAAIVVGGAVGAGVYLKKRNDKEKSGSSGQSSGTQSETPAVGVRAPAQGVDVMNPKAGKGHQSITGRAPPSEV